MSFELYLEQLLFLLNTFRLYQVRIFVKSLKSYIEFSVVNLNKSILWIRNSLTENNFGN